MIAALFLAAALIGILLGFFTRHGPRAGWETLWGLHCWWHLREALDPAYEARLALPPDDLLVGDLTAPHWRVTSSGRIQVESKDDIKKHLGRSTDDGDAVMQALWGGVETEAAAIQPLAPELVELLTNFRGV